MDTFRTPYAVSSDNDPRTEERRRLTDQLPLGEMDTKMSKSPGRYRSKSAKFPNIPWETVF
jgi:hypothetical protein